MSLATRCPFCETVFRLQSAHLAPRRGLVRCGHCHEVFDAASSLFELAEGADFADAKPLTPQATAEILTAAQQPAPGAQRADFSNPSWDPWAPAPGEVSGAQGYSDPQALPYRPYVPDPGTVTPPQAPSQPAAAVAATDPPKPRAPWQIANDTPAPEPTLATGALAAAADGEPHFGSGPRVGGPEPFTVAPAEDGEDHFAVVRETRAPNRGRLFGRLLGILVCLLLLVLLLGQLAWWQRETVMVYLPQSQGWFVKACARLGCTLTPPRDIDGLQVEPSDLRQVDGPHKLELRMPLRNRYDVALAWPAVELTLLDEHNDVALRRVLQPADYVRPGTSLTAGLPPHTTQTMIVRLDTGSATASNFRVQIFYP